MSNPTVIDAGTEAPTETVAVVVSTNGNLPTADDFARAGRSLGELAADGNKEALFSAASEAEAVRVYHEMQGHRQAANGFARLKVEAQALIGEIDVNENPVDRKGLDPLWIDGVKVASAERRYWRMLGIARMRGALGRTMAMAEKDNGDISTNAACAYCVRLGVGWVPCGALQTQFEKTGLSADKIARSAGVSRGAVAQLVGRSSKQTIWVNARKVAERLGVDPATLPLAPPTRKRSRRARLWTNRQRKMTGGRWDECYSRFRLCLDEFARLVGEDTCWDDAYTHFYALERAIARQMKREALS